MSLSKLIVLISKTLLNSSFLETSLSRPSSKLLPSFVCLLGPSSSRLELATLNCFLRLSELRGDCSLARAVILEPRAMLVALRSSIEVKPTKLFKRLSLRLFSGVAYLLTESGPLLLFVSFGGFKASLGLRLWSQGERLSGDKAILSCLFTRIIGWNCDLSIPLSGLMTRRSTSASFSSGITCWTGAWCFW